MWLTRRGRALAIASGQLEGAEWIMSHFGWGQNFLDINERFLEAYMRADDAEGVLAVQAEMLAAEAEASKIKKPIDWPSSDSSSDEDEPGQSVGEQVLAAEAGAARIKKPIDWPSSDSSSDVDEPVQADESETVPPLDDA